MRASLFYNPAIMIDRLAIALQRRRRRQCLRGTPASKLGLGHIESLELLQLLRSNSPHVVYDIGANVGTWTCLAKSLFPAARIEAFEPLGEHEKAFHQWTAPWAQDVHLHRVALGPTEGFADMRVTSFSDASSLLSLTPTGCTEFNIKEVRTERVQIATLDGLVAAGTIPLPDLIKLDVQGYELEVLRGAEKCMTSASAILCEVSFRAFYAGQPLFHDVVGFMLERGFTLHAFGANVAPATPLSQTDALFLRLS